MNAAPLLSLVLAASAAGSVEPSNAPAIDDRGAATIAEAGTPNDPGFDDAALQQRAQARFAAYQTWQSDLYDALAASAEPLDWALASRLYLADANRTTVPLRPTRDDLLDLAIGRAPDDVLVQWLAATDRIGASACEARPSADEPLANLKRLESDNAAIWLLALDVAVARHDAAAVDDAVIRMAASTRYDEPFGALVTAWLGVYAEHPPPIMQGLDLAEIGIASPARQRFALAWSQAIATTLPGYQAPMSTCTADIEDGNWRRHAWCEDAARIMTTRATTLTARNIGFALLRKLGGGQLGDADRTARRGFDWLAFHSRSGPGAGSASADLEALWKASGDEIEFTRRMMQLAGRPTEPPADWQPPDLAAPVVAD